MQGLYAYYNSMEANYNLCLDEIGETYNTYLLNDHSLDKKENEKKKKYTLKLFQEAVDKDAFPDEKAGTNGPEQMAKEFFDRYRTLVKKDISYFRKNIISGAEKIFNIYIQLMLLPGEMADIEQNENSPKTKSGVNQRKTAIPRSLNNNLTVLRLKNDPELNAIAKQKKIGWDKQKDIINDFYITLVKKNKEYLKYQESKGSNFEEDRNICLYLFKDILFKNAGFNDFMESIDISWFEDADVLKSMVMKTLKNLEEDKKGIELSTLSKNWPEDKEFFSRIYDITLKHDREYDEIIARKSKNWDKSRIASTDRIILKMAIGEMINFPGIPVKVTINEYIELSKNFSTPKSKKFVNGILDVVSNELLEKGVIKKSGRGLIDNH